MPNVTKMAFTNFQTVKNVGYQVQIQININKRK